MNGPFQTQLMANMKFNQLMSKKYPPPFVPNNETLNCDPTYELEEMIVEVPFIYYVSIFLGFLDPHPPTVCLNGFYADI